MFENAITPSKWIINYKFKTETEALTKEEKELVAACQEIEEYVIKEKPRRHGKGITQHISSFQNKRF